MNMRLADALVEARSGHVLLPAIDVLLRRVRVRIHSTPPEVYNGARILNRTGQVGPVPGNSNLHWAYHQTAQARFWRIAVRLDRGTGEPPDTPAGLATVLVVEPDLVDKMPVWATREIRAVMLNPDEPIELRPEPATQEETHA